MPVLPSALEMKKTMQKQILSLVAVAFSSICFGQETPFDDAATLAEQGREIFFRAASCNVCHGQDAAGLIGPSLAFGSP